MFIHPIKTRLFQEKENLLDFLGEYISGLKEGSIAVVTSKIVSLSEGRTAHKDKR